VPGTTHFTVMVGEGRSIHDFFVAAPQDVNGSALADHDGGRFLIALIVL
jgi:hypothetical protein